MDEAAKFDTDKLRYDLIAPEALEELARVYTFGAAKYADENWRKGMRWRRIFGAIMRHSWAWMRGEDVDQESGLPHLAHAAWGCFTLLAYSKCRLGEDDRPVMPSVSQQTPATAAPVTKHTPADCYAKARSLLHGESRA